MGPTIKILLLPTSSPAWLLSIRLGNRFFGIFFSRKSLLGSLYEQFYNCLRLFFFLASSKNFLNSWRKTAIKGNSELITSKKNKGSSHGELQTLFSSGGGQLKSQVGSLRHFRFLSSFTKNMELCFQFWKTMLFTFSRVICRKVTLRMVFFVIDYSILRKFPMKFFKTSIILVSYFILFWRPEIFLPN